MSKDFENDITIKILVYCYEKTVPKATGCIRRRIFDIAMDQCIGKVSSNIEEFEESDTGKFEGSGTEEFASSSIEEFEGSNTKESKARKLI
ncbi:hypothetical protein RhiirA1_472654 [Rhizophagus irregularis]|uniref:Uncharacterized protein n=1 Tax=Rhizophagus irregularis TaxID=588596 RepID=A0A2N0R1Y8_9GLOM|nr:hypothetical protein RhiirA1_472654 [Rhizophagus irregularis]